MVNTQSDTLPTLDSSTNLPDNPNINSIPSNPIRSAYTNVQPDILTHGNHTSMKYEVPPGEEHVHHNHPTPIADKMTMSSLYVEMIHSSSEIAKADNPPIYETVSLDPNGESGKIVSIPVFVLLSCVPLRQTKATMETVVPLNENQEIRLGTIHL